MGQRILREKRNNYSLFIQFRILLIWVDQIRETADKLDKKKVHHRKYIKLCWEYGMFEFESNFNEA